MYVYVCMYVCLYAWIGIYIYISLWGAFSKFPDFFCMGTFIDSTHMKL